MNYNDNVKIPWKQVECAKCKSCMCARFWKSDPADDGCKMCYLDRVRVRSEIARGKLEEIREVVYQAERKDVALYLGPTNPDPKKDKNYTDFILEVDANFGAALAEIRKILKGQTMKAKRKERR